MDQEDIIRRALQDYEAALAVIKKAIPGRPGFGNESRFGEAYQKLVQLGVKPQIRKKYRRK
jgi:hypothetical protein